MGDDIAEAERKERRSADIQVRTVTGHSRCCLYPHGVGEGRSECVVEEAEAEDEQNRPQEKKEQQRKGTVDAEDLFAHGFALRSLGPGGPGVPGGEEEEACDADAARWAAGQDNRLEGIERDSCTADDSGDQSEEMQGEILRMGVFKLLR